MNLYYSLYWRNVRKFLTREGKSFAVLGHLHTPHQERNFIVIGAFHDGYVYEDDEVIAISDVHLGIFDYPKEQLEKIKSILGRTDKKVIIIGDFFDLFYMTPQKLKEKYSDLIKLIKQREQDRGLIYLQGNHDTNITRDLGIPSIKKYVLGDKLFFHGHLCDPFYSLFPLNIFQYIRSKLGIRLRWLLPLYLKFHS